MTQPAHTVHAYMDHGDRMVVAMVLAAALHVLIILGISLTPETPGPQDDKLPTLDITLVPKNKTPPPKEADYLAQASQDGAGNTREKIRPQYEQEAHQAGAPPPTPTPAQTQDLARPNAQRKILASEDKAEADQPKPVSAVELMNRSLELVQLDQQLKQSMQAYSKLPRQAFVSARTQEFKYASYMNDWVSKVERIGNLNYPDEARRKSLSGSLMLQVSLNQDGSVRNIQLKRSSGYKVLDDAAIRIVQLASPFPPLPPEISKDTDILHITRTWEFINNQGLSTRH